MGHGITGAVALLLVSLLTRRALAEVNEVSSASTEDEDDDRKAVEALRSELEKLEPASYGVLLVAGPQEAAWSEVAVALWRAYCERHGYGFFVQRRGLTVGLRFEWTKPRALLEFAQIAKWGYLMLVDASSIPVDLQVTLRSAVKEHLRHKRYKQDDGRRRLMFCPWDCEEDYDWRYQDGACYAPQTSACIFHTKKPQTADVVRHWYSQRRNTNFTEDQRLFQTLAKTRNSNYASVYFKDVQKDIGRSSSRHIASFAFDPKYGWNIRDQIHDFVKKHPALSKIVNDAQASNPGRRKKEL